MTVDWKELASTTFLLQKVWNVLSLDQQAVFIISLIKAPFKNAFEVEAELVEWALKMSILISESCKTPFSHLETVEIVTSLCGLIGAVKRLASPYLRLAVFAGNLLKPCKHRDFYDPQSL